MTEFWLYACTITPRKVLLTQLLEKAMEKDLRVVVFCQNEAEAEALNSYLWNFSTESFLPHGTVQDGDEADQPIFLTHLALVPNDATFAIIWGEAEVSTVHKFDRVIVMADARFEKPALTETQKLLLQSLKINEPTMWVQSEDGKWMKG